MSTIAVTKTLLEAGPSCSDAHSSIEGPRTFTIISDELGSGDNDFIDLNFEPDCDLVDLNPAGVSKLNEMTSVEKTGAPYGENLVADNFGDSKVTITSGTTLVSDSGLPLPAAAKSSLAAGSESSHLMATEPPLPLAAGSSPAPTVEPSAPVPVPVTVPTADTKHDEKEKKLSLKEIRIQGGFVPRIRPRKIGTTGNVILAGRVGEIPVYHIVTPIERFLCQIRTKTSDGYRFIPQQPDRFVLPAETRVGDEKTDVDEVKHDTGVTYLEHDASKPNHGTGNTDIAQLENNRKHEVEVTLTEPNSSDSETDSSSGEDDDTFSAFQLAAGNEYFPEEPPTQTYTPSPFNNLPTSIPRDPSGNIIYNYQSYFEIKKSPVGGLGAFAVRDLFKGDIILMEAPILRTTGLGLFQDFRALDKDTQQIYLSLHAVEAQGVHKIERIRRANAFDIPGGIAILAIGSRFNHGCGAKRTVSYIYDPDRNVMVFEICADYVPAGQELLVKYGSSPLQLFRSFGFRCQCGGCEGVSDEDIRRLRAEEMGEVYRPAKTGAHHHQGTGAGTRYRGGW